MEKLENVDIIKKIYEVEFENIDKIIKRSNKEIKDYLKTINLEKVIGESNTPNELRKIFKDIEDNYNIKITKYNEEMYKKRIYRRYKFNDKLYKITNKKRC